KDRATHTAAPGQGARGRAIPRRAGIRVGAAVRDLPGVAVGGRRALARAVSFDGARVVRHGVRPRIARGGFDPSGLADLLAALSAAGGGWSGGGGGNRDVPVTDH